MIQVNRYLPCLFMIVLSLLGCTDSVDEYAARPTLKKVDSFFAPKFVSGEWRYRGARAIDKGIAIYIQIPDRIDLSESQQIDYIRITICPKTDDSQLWDDAFPYKLYVRTYNYVDRNFVETYCKSPLIQ